MPLEKLYKKMNRPLIFVWWRMFSSVQSLVDKWQQPRPPSLFNAEVFTIIEIHSTRFMQYSECLRARWSNRRAQV